MTPNHDEMLELCAGYVLESLDASDRRRLEAHLAQGCAECRAAIDELAEATLALAASAPSSRPSPAVKERVLEAVAREAATPAAPARAREAAPRRVWPWVGWALAAGLAVFSFLELRTSDDLRERLARTELARAELADRLGDEIAWTSTMASPEARVAFLAPTGDGGEDWAGWGLYDPASRRAILVLENLELGAEHDFELWAIRGDGPHSLGVIEIDAGGRAVVRLPRVENPADLAAFAVSYERKGGSPNPRQPSGPVVMVGNLEI